MAKAKLTALKRGLQANETFAKNSITYDGPGAVGMMIEDALETRGNKVNRGPGVDLPAMNLESKSRNEDSSSPHSVGSMSIDNIINTPWAGSSLRDKTITQLRTKWKNKDSDTIVITGSKVYDFSSRHIQDKIEEDYEHARTLLKNGVKKTYINGPNHYVHLQKQKGNMYQVRIYNKAMKNMEEFDGKLKSLKDNFDWGPGGL